MLDVAFWLVQLSDKYLAENAPNVVQLFNSYTILGIVDKHHLVENPPDNTKLLSEFWVYVGTTHSQVLLAAVLKITSIKLHPQK